MRSATSPSGCEISAAACSMARARTPTSSSRACRPICAHSIASPLCTARKGAGMKRTLFDKIWDAHVVAAEPGWPAVLYIDLHLVHEVTSPQAFAGLAARRLEVRRPDKTVATMDHSTPTKGPRT